MPRNRNGLIVFVWLLNLCCYGVFAGMQRRPLTPELSATLPTGPHSPTQSVNNCPKQLIPIPLNDVQLQQLSDGLLPLLKAKFASMVPPNAAPGAFYIKPVSCQCFANLDNQNRTKNRTK
jgi:hypothetical protein